MNLLAKREHIWISLVCFTLCSFAFSERINSWGLVLLAIFTLIDSKLITKIKTASWSSKLWPMLAFFFVYLIFFLFSDKGNTASHSLVSKLSFLIFPIIFYFENYFTKKNEKIILMAFSIALSIGVTYMLTRSLMDNYFFADQPRLAAAFGRMQVSSYIMHPGYYSAFLMFSIIWQFFNRSTYSSFFIALFTFGILVLLSRIVILFYFIFLLYIAWCFIKNSKNKIQSLGILFLLGIGLAALLYQLPPLKRRIHLTISNMNNTDKDKGIASATASRRIAYEQELKLVTARPIIGYGLGNATKTLRQHLQKKGYQELGKEMNTHCQYVNTWMQTGIVGLSTLLFLLFYNFRYFKKEKSLTALWLVLMISVCLLTDDLLEIQANGVFFALLLSLYLTRVKTISQ